MPHGLYAARDATGQIREGGVLGRADLAVDKADSDGVEIAASRGRSLPRLRSRGPRDRNGDLPLVRSRLQTSVMESVGAGAGRGVIVCDMDGPFGLIEFPADDADRARRFWSGLLGIELAERSQAEGRGWQSDSGAPAVGVHERGAGPGDTAALPYFTVLQMEAALEKVTALGGSVIHPGAQWSICRDSEGSPFGLALASRP